MKDVVNNDNLYPEGTILFAKTDPTLKLVVAKYKQRIYYCAVVGHPEQNTLAYFEKELAPPDLLNQVQYVRIDPVTMNKGYRIRDGFKKIDG